MKKIYRYYTPNRLKIRYRRECLGRGIDWDNLHDDTGAEEELDFIKKNRMLLPIPYEWTMKYHAGNYKVHKDKNGYFCLIENKKIYFPDEYAIDGTASEMVNALMMEQDIRSPHQYFSENVKIEEGDVLLDVGAAEGLITLQNIEKIKKAYLFECNPDWIKALQKTFEPWNEKVEIVNKYVADMNDETHTTLDEYIQKYIGDHIMIKMDIEGMETEVIPGGIGASFGAENIKFVCCTYHRAEDANDLDRKFKEKGYATEFSKGYMVWREEPYFRKGVIRAWK